jgi:hypothetical protein
MEASSKRQQRMGIIMTTKELKQHIRNGKYVWSGGYPVYFVASDGEALSFEAVKENFAEIVHAMRYCPNNGWAIEACCINWENENLICAHSGEKIEPAYGE